MRGYLRYRYLIALGSNQRHARYGRPRDVLLAAIEALKQRGIAVEAVSPFILSDPVGPSLRRYANGAAVIESDAGPEELLATLKTIEREFGRRKSGQRWRARVLDLDIVLWSGGAFTSPDLTIPHRLFRTRDFVLGPAAMIAPCWRDPISGFTLRQLKARLTARYRLPSDPPDGARALSSVGRATDF